MVSFRAWNAAERTDTDIYLGVCEDGGHKAWGIRLRNGYCYVTPATNHPGFRGKPLTEQPGQLKRARVELRMRVDMDRRTLAFLLPNAPAVDAGVELPAAVRPWLLSFARGDSVAIGGALLLVPHPPATPAEGGRGPAFLRRHGKPAAASPRGGNATYHLPSLPAAVEGGAPAASARPATAGNFGQLLQRKPSPRRPVGSSPRTARPHTAKTRTLVSSAYCNLLDKPWPAKPMPSFKESRYDGLPLERSEEELKARAARLANARRRPPPVSPAWIQKLESAERVAAADLEVATVLGGPRGDRYPPLPPLAPPGLFLEGAWREAEREAATQAAQCGVFTQALGLVDRMLDAGTNEEAAAAEQAISALASSGSAPPWSTKQEVAVTKVQAMARGKSGREAAAAQGAQAAALGKVARTSRDLQLGSGADAAAAAREVCAVVTIAPAAAGERAALIAITLSFEEAVRSVGASSSTTTHDYAAAHEAAAARGEATAEVAKLDSPSVAANELRTVVIIAPAPGERSAVLTLSFEEAVGSVGASSTTAQDSAAAQEAAEAAAAAAATKVQAVARGKSGREVAAARGEAAVATKRAEDAAAQKAEAVAAEAEAASAAAATAGEAEAAAKGDVKPTPRPAS